MVCDIAGFLVVFCLIGADIVFFFLGVGGEVGLQTKLMMERKKRMNHE